MPIPHFLAAAALLLLVWLARAQLLAGQQRRRARASYFDLLVTLFDHTRIQIQPSGFARMSGDLGHATFDLQAVPDTLTFRKLPALWVMLTLPQALPVKATLDLMARPTGNEPFSHFATLPCSLDLPDGFPAGLALRCDDPQALMPGILDEYTSVFDDPRVKELVISPKGLRLVILAEEADRGRYLLFRDAEMAAAPLPADRIFGLIQILLALRAEVIRRGEQA